VYVSIASLVFVAFLAAYLSIRGVFMHRARRDKAVSKADARDRVLVALVGIGQVVLPLLFVWTPRLAFADRAQPDVCTVLGGVAMVSGLWLFWRSHADLGESWSVTLELNANHRLVTRGVYRFVRHPMYSSFFVLGLGQALLLANWIAGLAGLASVALLVIVRVPNEERMMIEQFGDEYRNYVRRTGGVVPRLR
jgi:protein-S-isoprenylcysteine O-methyltransferase Ste14